MLSELINHILNLIAIRSCGLLLPAFLPTHHLKQIGTELLVSQLPLCYKVLGSKPYGLPCIFELTEG